jgi:RNA polymerase sigma-70 factor (ECF subfamily)
VDVDLEALQRWREGDQRAGQELCARHFAEIYRFFEHKVAGEADDLTQQTFLACVKSRDQFRGQSSFRTYLFSIARNELYMRLRRNPRFEHVDLGVSSFEELEDLVSSPSRQLGKHEELAQIRAALRQLPVDQQLLLELHYWHDLDAAALAEVLATSPGTIRVRLLRARRVLRDRLGANAVGGATDDPLAVSLRDVPADGDDSA